MADNIGGIVSAEFCPLDMIQYCGVTKLGLLLGYKKSNPWQPFKSGLGRITISVIPETVNGVSLYKISGEILCPRYQFGTLSEMNSLNDKKILLRKTLANGTILVAGDAENPVWVSSEILSPSSASGFSGVRYILSGTMSHPELSLL